MLKAGIYERSGADSMTRSTFYFLMGCILTWGFAATYIVSSMTANWNPGMSDILFVAFAVPLTGILISISSSAFLSFIGFNMVVISFGAVLGPLLAAYELALPGIVSHAALFTAIVTGIMGVSGFLFPDFYRSIGGALLGSLMVLVLVSILSMFLSSLRELTIIHYMGAAIFALYIGYDMYRASKIPATLDNAVDVCISLYLDIINLFLRLLRILGRRR